MSVKKDVYCYESSIHDQTKNIIAFNEIFTFTALEISFNLFYIFNNRLVLNIITLFKTIDFLASVEKFICIKNRKIQINS